MRRAKGFTKGSTRGFTLVEVLVALAIVSIALMAALRAAGQGTQAAGELRLRLFASWVAENRLAEHRARGDWLPLGIARGTQSQGGIVLAWREEVVSTPHPAFRRIDVFVSAPAEESRSLARLTGFLLQPK
jgi:general secretion pathway protein I